MRKIQSLAILLLLAVSFWAAGATTEDLFTKIKVTFTTETAPDYKMLNQRSTVGRNVFRNDWLVLNIDYTPKISGGKRLWIDDVTMQVAVASNKTAQRSPILMQGETRFWTIPLDGKKHTATMMIPPQLLDRYFRETATGRVATSNFSVEVRFVNRAGVVIGSGYYGRDTDAGLQKYFAQLSSDKEVLTVPGAVLPRHVTPWSGLQADEYDLIKPDHVK